jgi:hypothetical protein
MATVAILNFFNPQKLPHTTMDIPTKFHERNSKKNLIHPFFQNGRQYKNLKNR